MRQILKRSAVDARTNPEKRRKKRPTCRFSPPLSSWPETNSENSPDPCVAEFRGAAADLGPERAAEIGRRAEPGGLRDGLDRLFGVAQKPARLVEPPVARQARERCVGVTPRSAA